MNPGSLLATGKNGCVFALWQEHHHIAVRMSWGKPLPACRNRLGKRRRTWRDCGHVHTRQPLQAHSHAGSLVHNCTLTITHNFQTCIPIHVNSKCSGYRPICVLVSASSAQPTRIEPPLLGIVDTSSVCLV